MPSKSRSTLQQDTQKRRKDEQKLVEEDSESEGVEALDDVSDDESDVDAPRVVQWVDEDELEYEDSDDDEEPEASKAGPSSLVRACQACFLPLGSNIPNRYHCKTVCTLDPLSTNTQLSMCTDLSNLPMGALRKAQRALKQAQAVEDSDTEDTGSDAESAVEETSSQWGKQKLPEESSSRPSTNKRANKHAYAHSPISYLGVAFQRSLQSCGSYFQKTCHAAANSSECTHSSMPSFSTSRIEF